MLKKLFVPGKDSTLTSLALLVLRLWFGLTMLVHHGLDKLNHYQSMATKFFDPMHIGSKASFGLVLFAEIIAAAALAIGLFTRFAALVLAIEMATAFVTFHKMTLSGAMPGELAFVYFGSYLTLLIAGGGKFSVDKAMFGKGGSSQSK